MATVELGKQAVVQEPFSIQETPLPTYESLMEKYRMKSRLQPWLGGEIPILNGELSHYNPNLVKISKRISLLSRDEPFGEKEERSSVVPYVFDNEKKGFVPTEFKINNAQDPNAFQIGENKFALAYVAVTPSLREKEKGKILKWKVHMHPMGEDGSVDMSKVAAGRYGSKDTRIAYVGDELYVECKRERKEKDQYNRKKLPFYQRIRLPPNQPYIVSSCLKIGMFPVPDTFAGFGDTYEKKFSTYHTIPVIEEDGKTWFGPNQIIPLESEGDYKHVGILFHIGRWEWIQSKPWMLPREYAAATVQCKINIDTGQMEVVQPARILATVSDYQTSVDAKRPDLAGVFFAGNMFFYEHNGDTTTFLIGGLKDSASGIRRIDYPFSRPIDKRYNRLFYSYN